MNTNQKRGPFAGLFFASLDENIIALDFDSGLYFAFSGADAETWRILASTGDVRQAAAHIVTTFGVTIDTAIRDIDAAVNELQRQRAVSRGRWVRGEPNKTLSSRKLRFVSPFTLMNAVCVAAIATYVEVLLSRRPVDDVARRLGLQVATDGATPPHPHQLSRRQQLRLRGLQTVYKRWPFGDTCLRRALTGGWFLRSRKPVLHFGARLEEDSYVAHAWLDCGDFTINETHDYVELTQTV